MDKKTIKFMIDTIKGVIDRPGVWGAQFTSHEHEGDKSYAYFSDGYVAVRLECGTYPGLHSINEDMWVGGEQLKGAYANLKGRDIYLNLHHDGDDHADIVSMVEGFLKDGECEDGVAINAEVFKKLAPLGPAYMQVKKVNGRSIVLFSGYGFKAIACPLIDKEKERLCKYV